MPARACVGTNCMLIWSTADGGGALTIDWDFANRDVLQTFKAFCAGGECLYSTIDPGFMAVDSDPRAGFFTLAAGTMVSIEIVAIDEQATLKINGVGLAHPGDRTLLGSAGTLHVHPTWQLTVADGVEGDFALSFKLTTDSPLYSQSALFSVRLTNRPPPPTATPTIGPSRTPTPTATAAAPVCAGDCDGNGAVTVAELIAGVASVLDNAAPCAALDRNGDGVAIVGEMIAAVNALLNGCPATPTPTETPAPTLDQIQATIFSPRCAIATCHDRAVASGGLVLVDADTSYGALVGAAPTVDAARLAGMLRVDAGHPGNSFLLTKLTGPPAGQGGRMPLTGDPLSDADVALIRAWITTGAPR
ncbi:MAG TPA: hypothetical protein VL049_28995 [Candidatus Dormibacteraeota bacterium]|nr:hypothetical protein [Candidatus Dormibacteraeota bacterium]